MTPRCPVSAASKDGRDGFGVGTQFGNVESGIFGCGLVHTWCPFRLRVRHDGGHAVVAVAVDGVGGWCSGMIDDSLMGTAVKNLAASYSNGVDGAIIGAATFGADCRESSSEESLLGAQSEMLSEGTLRDPAAFVLGPTFRNDADGWSTMAAFYNY
jgi:hypothetical protein